MKLLALVVALLSWPAIAPMQPAARMPLAHPVPALRARLVHVPAGDRRQELMIIYAEASASAGPPTAKESADVIARAQAGLRLIR